MTDTEAKVEATRRWGNRAVFRDRKIHSKLVPRYMVGVLFNPELNNNVIVHGEGLTWEEAFADADSRTEFFKNEELLTAKYCSSCPFKPCKTY
jgi:hypothetical protein